MKSYRMVGSFALALGFMAPHAYAQSAERVAALDPASVPPDNAVQPPAPAPSAAVEPGAAPAVPVERTETSPAPAVTTAAPAPRAARVSAPPLTSSFDSRPKDAAAAPSALELPIRSRRRLALLGELGWNSLGGFGAVLTYNAHPHLAFDLAGGFSLTGWKAGLRGRYNLLTGPFTPFIGAGLSMSAGLKGVRLSGRDRSHGDGVDHFDPNQDGKYDVKPSEFAQAVVGFEFMHVRGFTLQGTAGYSWLLNRNNFDLVAGTPHNDLASAFFGSGPVISTAVGYAFN